jgi:hypothetical protein
MNMAAPAETITPEPVAAPAVIAVAMALQELSAVVAAEAVTSAMAARAAPEMILQLHLSLAAAEEEAEVPVVVAVVPVETMAAVVAAAIAVPMAAPELRESSSSFILLEKHSLREICSIAERRDHDGPLEN